MKEKVRSLFDERPLWVGLVCGFIVCLLLIGVIRIFATDSDGGFNDAEQVLKEDYLRLSVRDNVADPNSDRAVWRFTQLGEEGTELLGTLKKDELTDPLALLNFSSLVSDSSFADPEIAPKSPAAEVTTPQTAVNETGQGIPLIGVIFIILVGLILLCSLFLFYYSRSGNKFRTIISNLTQRKDDDKASWSVREDDNFDLGTIINRFPEEPDTETDSDEYTSLLRQTDSMIDEEFEDEELPAAVSSDLEDDLEPFDDDDESANPEPDGEDLAGEIRNSRRSMTGSDFSAEAFDSETADITPNNKSDDKSPLVHYQTTYKLGDDLFDETFSLDEEDERFLGECGIGIAETINSTDPKAVTAFEIWLFDREDVQTPTYFLLSEFAYSNDQMLLRLKNKGRFDKIVNGSEYILESHSLKMAVKINALEYGSENGEKNSYFNKVLFDVCVWKK
ncbi:MAG: hypothetical protein AB9907_00555 [Flexilinea sp.]